MSVVHIVRGGSDLKELEKPAQELSTPYRLDPLLQGDCVCSRKEMGQGWGTSGTLQMRPQRKAQEGHPTLRLTSLHEGQDGGMDAVHAAPGGKGVTRI